MKRTVKTLAAYSLVAGMACLLLGGCGAKSGNANDVDERKIFSGDASKMPESARQQMEAAAAKGKAGAQMPKPAQ